MQRETKHFNYNLHITNIINKTSVNNGIFYWNIEVKKKHGEVVAFPTVSLQITIFKHKLLNQHN